MVTCGSSDRGFGRVQAVPVDGLGATPPLFGPAGGSGFDDGVHVLHQFQLLPPEILLLDELAPGLVFLLPDSLLLRFQSGVGQQTSILNLGSASRLFFQHYQWEGCGCQKSVRLSPRRFIDYLNRNKRHCKEKLNTTQTGIIHWEVKTEILPFPSIPDIPCLLLFLFQLRLQLHLLLQTLLLPPHPFLQQRSPLLSHVLLGLPVLLSRQKPQTKNPSSQTEIMLQGTASMMFLSHAEASPRSLNLLLNTLQMRLLSAQTAVIYSYFLRSCVVHPCSLFKHPQHVSTAVPELFTRAPV